MLIHLESKVAFGKQFEMFLTWWWYNKKRGVADALYTVSHKWISWWKISLKHGEAEVQTIRKLRSWWLEKYSSWW